MSLEREVSPPGQGLSLGEPPDDPRIVAALILYLDAVEAGDRPDRRAFLARQEAEVRVALADCLDGVLLLRRLAAHLTPTHPDRRRPGDT